MKAPVAIIILLSVVLLGGCDDRATRYDDKEASAAGDDDDDQTAPALAARPAAAIGEMPREHTPIFPRANAPSHLAVYDARADAFEMQLLLTTLQGVINKSEPRIYLILVNSVDEFWLQEMVDDYGVTTETIGNAWDLFERFKAELSGFVVYDPALPATANLAATIAGIEQAVVAAPTLTAELESRGLTGVEDLRGRFPDNVALYEWAMDEIWPDANHGIMCFSDPLLATLRDYLTANDIMTVMLDPHVPAERALLEEILAETPAHIPLLGWAIDELLGVIIFSEHAKFHVASDWARNLSVYSGLPFPELAQDHQNTYAPAVENKIYLAFAYTDGDNVAYSLDAMWSKWNDPARGEIPLGWEVSFNLVDLGPQAIRYYYETKTGNDMFIGPACGVGYIYPNRYPDLDAFLELTAPYMQAADMDTIWLINDDLTLPDDQATAYARALDLHGIFIDYWPNLDKGFYFASDGTPVVRSQYVYLLGAEQIAEVLAQKELEKQYLYPDSPFFVFIGVNGWSTTPTFIKGIIDGLDDQYEVLRPDALFAAMRKAHAEGWEF